LYSYYLLAILDDTGLVVEGCLEILSIFSVCVDVEVALMTDVELFFIPKYIFHVVNYTTLIYWVHTLVHDIIIVLLVG
jgi:hypothetical protein